MWLSKGDYIIQDYYNQVDFIDKASNSIDDSFDLIISRAGKYIVDDEIEKRTTVRIKGGEKMKIPKYIDEALRPIFYKLYKGYNGEKYYSPHKINQQE